MDTKYIYTYNRTCRVCNRPFSTSHYNAKHCSSECISKAISASRKVYTPEQETQAIALRRQGMSNPDISEQLGMGIPFLKKLFRIGGVKLTPEQKRVILAHRWQDHNPIREDTCIGITSYLQLLDKPQDNLCP